ncbi:hypothetical protein lbkm_0646 [Lachnospiraceae bacterium KM106-2]|nr:hypothetical protein lbkm_0646 [Lachnospiraceae bacterium KM106-2]
MMSAKRRVKNVFNGPYIKAILKREKVQRPYIILDNLLYNVGMKEYADCAKNRIFDLKCAEELLADDNIILDYLNLSMWLDKKALESCKEIILGYVSEKCYERIVDLLESQIRLVEIENDLISSYQEMKIIKLLVDLFHYAVTRKGKMTVFERKCICICHLLELTSRTLVVKVYWKIDTGIANIKATSILCKLPLYKNNCF